MTMPSAASGPCFAAQLALVKSFRSIMGLAGNSRAHCTAKTALLPPLVASFALQDSRHLADNSGATTTRRLGA
jgi:hypothetical protein